MDCRKKNAGFTLIETFIVSVILAIAAMITVPMLSSASSMQIKSASNMIASDLEYAKSLAISRQQTYTLQFSTVSESYRILDSDGNVIKNPLNPVQDFIIDFSGDSRLNKVDIQSADFDSGTAITFDYLGSPYSGSDTTTPMNSGSITIDAGGIIKTITVEPITGYIRIN